ncbi:hypothetical protein AU195_01930 [Mycobacterium sp. IS-1496]|nr:hypothetical protein AU195_01930 [Mycobacterium sp. IS-1496]
MVGAPTVVAVPRRVRSHPRSVRTPAGTAIPGALAVLARDQVAGRAVDDHRRTRRRGGESRTRPRVAAVRRAHRRTGVGDLTGRPVRTVRDLTVPELKDANGARWRVRRRWMPLLDRLDMLNWGNDWFGLLLFVIALPLVLAWPFWALGKLCGVPWKVVVTREGEDVAEERIKGWRASGRRIAEIVDGIRVAGVVPAPGAPPQDLRPYT